MDSAQDFTSGSIPLKLARFMFPALGALILQAMYSAVDLLIVGRFGTTAGISGITTGSGVMNLFTFGMCSLATGVTVLIGRYLGEHVPERIGSLLGESVVFFLIFSAVCSAVLIGLAPQIAVVMQAPAEALDLTVQYIRICGAGYTFVVFYNFISGIFRGLGNSRLPLVFVGIACVVNIVGDLILVAGLHMNVAGAAIATIAAQAVSVLLSILIIRRMQLPFTIRRKDLKLGKQAVAFFRIGAPLALQDVLTNLTFLALCAFINALGLDASSGYGVGQKIQSLVMLIPSSLMQCMAPFVSQNVGAGREARARKGMLWGMGMGASIGLFIALFIFFRGDLLAALFTSDAAVTRRAFEFLRGFAPEAVVTSVLFSYMGYFNGHSKSLFVMLQGLVQSFCIRLPMSYLMSIRPNASLTGIGLAAPTATCVGIVICTVYYLHMHRQLSGSRADTSAGL